MRFLTSEQQLLSERLTLDTVPVVVITAYSARPQSTAAFVGQPDRRKAGWVVSKQWAFSDSAFQIGNLDVQPFLVSMTPYSQSIDATPEDRSVGSGLLRNFDVTLRNGEADSGVRMIEELRDNNIEQADILAGQISLNRRTGQREVDALAASNLGELAVFYRGSVQQVGTVTNDAINLFCNTGAPLSSLGRYTITDGTADTFLGDIRATSTAIPLMYGNNVRRIPGVPWSIGFQTTLKNVMNPTQSTADLTDTPTAATVAPGTLYIAGERCDYLSISGDTVIGLTRVAGQNAEHAAGETVSFIPVNLTFATAIQGEVDAVEDVIDATQLKFYFRNPATGELMRQDDDATHGSTAGTRPPAPIGYASYTAAGWEAQLAAMANSAFVTQQPEFNDNPPTAVDFQITVLDADEVNDGTGNSARGSWSNKTLDDPKFTHNSGLERKKIERTISLSDIAVPSRTATPFRCRFSVNITDITLGGATTATMFASLPVAGFGTLSFTADVVANGLYSSEWLGLDGATVITDLFVGEIAECGWEQGSIDDGGTGYTADTGFLVETEAENLAGVPQTVQTQITAAASGAGVEAYFDLTRQEPATTAAYLVPGISLHQQSGWNAASNAAVETQLTAWATYVHAQATASSGDLVIEYAVPDGTLDMESDTVSFWQGWIDRVITNPGGVTSFVLMVTDEVVVFPTVPTASRTWTDSTIVDGVFEQGFSSAGVDVLTPDLTNVRTVRVTLTGLTLATTTLDVWWIGPRRTVAEVFKGTFKEGIVHPVDHLRTYLTTDALLPTVSIDEASIAALYTNLGTTKIAQILSSDWGVGSDNVAFLLAFGRDHRFQMVSTETDSNTVFRWFAASTSFAWPAATVEITQFGDVREIGIDGAQIYTRRTFGYNPDRANGAGGSATWQGAYLVSAEQNDIPSTITTTDIDDQEALVGERIGPDMFLPSVVDDVSAEDIAGYYFDADLTSARVFEVPGVPWVEAYALELSDIITLTPPWYTTPLKLRVIETVKNWRTEMVDIVGVEVA